MHSFPFMHKKETTLFCGHTFGVFSFSWMRRKIRLKVLRHELCAKHAVRSEQGVVIVRSITPWSKMVLYFRVSHKWEVWIWSSGRSTDSDVDVVLLKFLAINWRQVSLCAHYWIGGVLSTNIFDFGIHCKWYLFFGIQAKWYLCWKYSSYSLRPLMLILWPQQIRNL